MKKMVFYIIPLIMVIMGCASSGTPIAAINGNSPGIELDTAIKEAATQMGENLPGETKIALVSMASSSAQFSEYVISRLEAALVNGKKLVVVDRANLDKIREEQGFQLSGEVDDDSAKSIGKLLGAGAIVTGSFTNLGDVYSLTLKTINIETATVVVSYPADISKSTRIETLLASGGSTGTQMVQRGNTSRNATVPTAPEEYTPVVPVEQILVQPAVPTTQTQKAPNSYKVGDIGPAGGLVFYDKGNNIDGWRYLEAAPKETEVVIEWGSSVSRPGTATDIGTGKQNTEVIEKYIRSHGYPSPAVKACFDLVARGFDDWFLPSKDELNLMWKNLKMEALGSFGNDYYWSSSLYSNGNAWSQRFSDGDQKLYDGGYYKYSVRAIRAF